MKKLTAILKITAFTVAVLILGGGCDDGLGEYVGDEEVMACFNLVNKFRTGQEAYYYSDDTKTTTTSLVGKLEKLTLDENLCKAAGIRAKEIVKSFSHTRPNGSSCFTVLKENSISYGWCGENIAAGSSTGAATFNQWKEDNLPKSQQGHRINMLSPNAKKIGIAYTYSANSTYKYYWVMILTN